MGRNLLALDIPALRPLPLVYEYGRLAMKKELSQNEMDMMDSILGEAEKDGVLTFWICQVDHFVAHELGHLSSPNKAQFEDQIAWLQEYLDTIAYPNT